MGRTRRILADDPSRTGENPLGTDVLVTDASDHVVIDDSPVAAHFGASQLVIWADGLISFGPVTAAQQAFMDARQPGDSAFGFPGDFIAVGFTGAQVTTDLLQTALLLDTTPDEFGDYGFDDAVPATRFDWGGAGFASSFGVIFSDDMLLLRPGNGFDQQVAFRIGTQSFDGAVEPLPGSFPYVADYHLYQGDAGADTLFGSEQTDRMVGAGGNDTLHGAGGDDVLTGGIGNDLLDGGAGRDVADYSADTAPIVVNITPGLAISAGTGGTDTLQSVEDALGGAGNDHLIAGLAAAADILKPADFFGVTSLDGAFDLQDNAEIGQATLVPHATVRATGGGAPDYYVFTVTAAGTTATFDIDGVSAFDAVLRVYDAGGTKLVTGNETAGGPDPGSATTSDSLLTYTFAAPGTYTLEVNAIGANVVPAGAAYTLHVSLANVQGSVLGGGAGADALDSGRGSDVLDGGAGIDTASFETAPRAVSANLATGIATGDGIDTLIGIENLTGSAFNDVLTGDDNANVLRGGAGNDRLVGGAGSDTAAYDDATAGVTLSLALTTAQASGGSGSETLIGIENLRGSSFNDVLTGNSGDNVIEGGAGNDSLTGGGGSDTASYANATAAVTVNLATTAAQATGGAGTDTLSGFANLLGSRFADTLTGNAAANRIDGGVGADAMAGGGGDDIYIVDNVGDTVTEAAGAGYDMVQSAVTWTLGANVEALLLTGSSGLRGTGNALANSITGNAAANQLSGEGGNDILDGGLGLDTLTGGAGDDLYILADADIVVEAAGGGYDTVQSAVTYMLAANVEALVLTGGFAIDGTGNALDNSITGNAADNVLNGGAGNDVLVGGGGNDTASYAGTAAAVTVSLAIAGAQATGGAGTDTLTGFANLIGGNGADMLTGTAAANRIDGGAGADRMTGGGGNDVYVVDRSDDVVVEAAGGGDDLVLAGADYVLSAEVERLTLTGGALAGTGNAGANIVIGNDLDNLLAGGGGNDSLSGGLGNDRLDGGAGNDAMAGGAGDDVYVVDSSGDSVTEAFGAGIDTVRAAIDYGLGADVENLELTGATGRSGTGNALDNRITGTAANDTLSGAGGNDVLDGGAGADIMSGGADRDTYVVDNLGDQTIEAQFAGIDLVKASLSWTLAANLDDLTLTGTDAIDGTGNDESNRIVGNIAANTLSGGAGNDTLAGGGGNDSLHGGLGFDIADYSDDSVGVIVDIAAGTATGAASGSDTLDGIESVVGGSGNDRLIAGGALQPDIVKPGSVVAGSAATAINLSGFFDLAANPDIADATTIPHATVIATSGGTIEYYRFSVGFSNTTGTFDIDGTSGFDSKIQLYDQNLNPIAGASNDDAGGDPGSPSGLDSRLSWTFAQFGTYYIGVQAYPGVAVPAGQSYTLHVSLPNAVSFDATLDGGAGDDLLLSGVGNDVLIGGAGTDTVSWERAASGVRADMTFGIVDASPGVFAAFDSLSGIENLTGSAFADELDGDGGNNVLRGGAGADQLRGGDGNDLLAGDAGNDTLDGGAGIDIADFSADTAGVTINLATGTATGGATGSDTLAAIEGARGGTGNDLLVAGGIADTVDRPTIQPVTDNFTFATAISLDGAFDLRFDPDITASTGVPHATVEQAESAKPFEVLPGFFSVSQDYYYSFTVSQADSQVLIDIDSDANAIQRATSHDLDAIVELYTADGVLVASSDDSDVVDSGSSNVIDSFLDTVVATPGTYVIRVTSYDGYFNEFGSPQFRMHVSVGDYGLGSRLDGGAGDDMLVSGIGSDLIEGGAGTDTLRFADGAGGVTVDLAAGVADGRGHDALSGIENAIGTAFDDVLVGTGANNLLIGGAGNDRIDGAGGSDTTSYADATSGVTANLTTGVATGGGGTDTLIRIENLIGTAFNDVLTGNALANLIDGGAGTGADRLDGGAGIDTVTYASAGARVAVNLSLTTAQNTLGAGADTLAGFENLTGSAYGDTLTGTAADNGLDGGLGNDIVNGLAGNDTLRGGDGNDTLAGGDGNDLLDGGAGSDIASYATATAAVTVSLLVAGAQATGGGGTDTLTGIEGLVGTAFNDVLTGSAADNSLVGGLGNDLISGDLGADTIDGGSGVDTLDYSLVAAGVTINLLSQSPQNSGGAGIDTIRNVENLVGTAFDDVLTGNAFANGLSGGAGNDLLAGGLGNDVLDGGTGSDTANYFGLAAGVKVNLTVATAQSTGGGGVDTLTGIESINGTGFDDQLTGNAADNNLVGNAGNDLLIGGLGNDLLSGGAGIDTASYAGATVGVTVNLAIATAQDTIGAGIDTLASIENLVGSAVDDTLTGTTANNVLTGGLGNDVLDGGASGADTLDGGAGNDTLRGQAANDLLIGGAGNDLIDGGAGIDTVSYAVTAAGVTVDLGLATAQNVGGGQGIDTLVAVENIIGSGFGDTLTGSAVANVLTGGGGKDSLTGGAGNDRFVYLATADSAVGANADRITDVSAGDILDLSAIDANASTAGIDDAFSRVGSFSNVAGQFTLAFDAGSNTTTLLADTDGNGAADFSILFTGDVTALTGTWVL